WIQSILGFAPLTKLSNANEFAEIKTRPHIRSLDLDMQIEALANRSIRFYIGNRDRRVGTTHCFDLVKTLAEEAYKKRISSSPIELIVGPSIGYQGHGTSDETFSDGALWIKNKLML
ncbi:MAG: alpha/beta hydrolase, partial [Simkaniaceae bacterium]|nr:alpha/beta hydrolase [Simkaniaceae bacterium]